MVIKDNHLHDGMKRINLISMCGDNAGDRPIQIYVLGLIRSLSSEKIRFMVTKDKRFIFDYGNNSCALAPFMHSSHLSRVILPEVSWKS